MATITVVGSINIDTVLTCDRFPTTQASSYATGISYVPGGKGANQAVALARLGSSVSLIGCVGNDANGQRALDNLQKNGVNCSGVTVLDAPTGAAFIHVVNGQNAITKAEGANAAFTPAQVDQHLDLLLTADVVLMQFSIPRSVIEHTASLCRKHQKMLIINPAPCKEINHEVYDAARYITPNQHEFEAVTGCADAYESTAALPGRLIVTLGRKGVLFHDGRSPILLPPHEHGARVDATGAGDCFNGAFCHFISEGMPLRRAIELANTCAGISVTHCGAQTGLPFAHQITHLAK